MDLLHIRKFHGLPLWKARLHHAVVFIQRKFRTSTRQEREERAIRQTKEILKMDRLLKCVTIAFLIAASNVFAQEKQVDVEKPEQFPLQIPSSARLDGAPTGGMDAGAGAGGGGQGNSGGGGIPTIDIAKIIKETLTNMLLGSVLDPSTLLGKAYGILDVQMQKLDINQQELKQLTDIYETFGEALTISAGENLSGQYDFANTIAQNSDSQERVFQASLQQARQLGVDPTQIMAMRELNNQNIRLVMFSETTKKVKELSGQPMTWTQRMALQNVLQQLNSDMLGQATLNALIAQSIKSMQSLQQSQDAKVGQQQINAILAAGGKIDPTRDVEDYAPPTPAKQGYYDYRGSEHIFFDDYKRALENMPAAEKYAGNQGIHPVTGQPMGQNAAQNQTASFNNIIDKPGDRDMAQGTITVNGRTYNFNSGGSGRGYLPPGEYTISNLQHTSQAGMVSGRGTSQQFGYKAYISDKYDSRVGGTRSLLRIHPDEGNNGTQGCIGIVGDPSTQRQFYSDLQSELQRNGGTFQLKVG